MLDNEFMPHIATCALQNIDEVPILVLGNPFPPYETIAQMMRASPRYFRLKR